MADTVVVEVPDIGDFTDVPVIEVHVAVGSEVALDEPLLTLESDKATMDVPAEVAGTVREVNVAVGDTVSRGTPILVVEPTGDGPPSTPAPVRKTTTAADRPAVEQTRPAAPTPSSDGHEDRHVGLVVLGAGPGGYTAAFRAADLGLEVLVVDARDTLGGVCLNVGCIPSKALLHAAKVIAETKEMSEHGLRFGAPEIDLDALRSWKDGVVGRLTGGLTGLAKQRKVSTLQGHGRFVSPHRVEVTATDGTTTVVGFDQAIVAVGSEPVRLPFVPHDDPRVLDSTTALDLAEVPGRLLVLGGGIIGLEMATVYAELGSRITVVELMDQIIPGADKDLVKPLAQHIGKRYEDLFLSTKVTDVTAGDDGLTVSFEGGKAPATATFDAVLVAVGRRPNGAAIGLDAAGVAVDDRGFVPVDERLRTNVEHVFAIGDVVGQPMLAHKAVHEGKVAAEVAAGQKSAFDARCIPSVAYTDPEVAWVGVTENEAKARGLSYGSGTFPWAASGRSLSLGRSEGSTKILFDTETDRIIGAGIVGPAAGDLIAEAGLAIEMGADAADIGLTIHPHPTLSETIGMAADAFEGTLTDLYIPKKTRT
ncbi:MAG: Dihydrolipoamide dehydrogenase of pyruvate dehydrogenase complex [uncultured Actinomycetospora sp.]|uniref:Dihydrolipoyl dehydrogenase n=1 Tax=uncultured Actinomycetospora sp. TaxID=1135996 RepID=A0A6J4J524_9PSEU|nr:MAG: Dihydrolipoamide dehydrogenase of pyruvate dehydrogenase complex [uncultured Actinomycetospora sp.]